MNKRTQRSCRIGWSLLVLVVVTSPCLIAAEPKDSGLNFFESQVLPVLRQHCLKCHSHSAGKARGGLVLDSRQAILAGGDSGAAAVPGQLDRSLLIEAIQYASDDLQMPPDGKIEDEQIAVLIEWVRRGLPAPESNASTAPQTSPSEQIEHWAFQPLHPVAAATHGTEGSEAIDYLVAAARSKAGVEPVGSAQAPTLVRRLYLDLIGLPPSPEEAAELAELAARGATEELVDRLLEMPEFGERWGRHWLDIARYADSNGCSIESNNTYDNAWRYRDYVISAWNDDKPYDQFVVEQIAGDQLDYVSTTERCEQLVATGFLLLGPKAFGTSGFEQFRLDVIDEQIDTVGKAMLGLSLGCARCHDHKFDPVPTKDYYALAGVFGSTESVRQAKGWRQGRTWNRVKLPVLDSAAEKALQAAYDQRKKEAESGELTKRAAEQLRLAETEMERLKKESSSESDAMAQAEELLRVAAREIKNARNMAKVMPVISPLPVAMAVIDKEAPQDEAVRVRGEADNRGDIVPRRVLTLFGDADHPQPAIPAAESGRLQLAKWLVDDKHGAGALLARVAVNRVWGHLFSRPLVASADNFGLTGDPPSHPELLDYLAIELIESEWSMKSLIREIVLSETYGLSAAAHAANQDQDPANRWLWRYEPKRIDIEVLRDSMLAVTGQLDRTRGGKTLQHLGLVSLRGDHILLDSPSPYRRRSIYLPIFRDAIGLTSDIDASMGMLSTFDFADPNLMAGLRPQTVAPAQALFLMNGEFVFERAAALAEQLMAFADRDSSRIDRLTQLAYGRHPGEIERQQMLNYLADFSAADNNGPTAAVEAWTSLCQAVFGSNEFLFHD